MSKSFLTIITLFSTLSLSIAQNLKLYKINNKVGYIIDSVEREEFHLFPSLSNFEFARILTKNDSTYYADITFHYDNSLAHFYIKLTPREFKRLLFCIENSERIKSQTAQDKYALLAYNRFWNHIETRLVSCLGAMIGVTTVVIFNLFLYFFQTIRTEYQWVFYME